MRNFDGPLATDWISITVATIIQKVVTDFAVEANAKSKELKTSYSLKHKGGMQQIG